LPAVTTGSLSSEAPPDEANDRDRADLGGSSDPLSRWCLAPAALAFLVVSLVQSWGLIEDDTKMPMVLAPFQFLSSALNLWNQQVFGGSVNQTGLIFPMGVYFGLTHLLHIPTWVAERIWLAGVLLAAFWGVVRLAEALGIGTRSARILGAIAFCVSPIVVTWAQTSADLLAVALLPWMLIPLVHGSRIGSPRRAAARSGVAVALMGGGNAVVVFATLPLGLIWLATRTPGQRRRQLTLWWFVSIGLAVSWWIASTALNGKYGFNYLPFTETSQVTTATASAFEAVRGASYWLNYYALKNPLLPGAWTLVSVPIVIVGSSAIVALGMAGLCRRIPERLFLVTSFVFAVTVIGIGYSGALAGPFSHTVQHLLQTKLALLRNIGKFSGDVALPVSLGLAWCVSPTSWRVSRSDSNGVRRPVSRAIHAESLVHRILPFGLQVVVVAALIAASAPFWQQNLYNNGGFSATPAYWTQTGKWLDNHQGHENAMLVPGSAFASYTWGNPGDEPLQFLSNTSVEWRNLIPLGSQGYIQMLDTVENYLDNGVPTPGMSEYLARGGVKYVIERNDLNRNSSGAPPPAQVHQVLMNTAGLRQVAAFGPRIGADQAESSSLPVYQSTVPLRAVEIFEVTDPSGIVQTYPASNPLVVSGDVSSLLPLSGANQLTRRASVLSGDLKSGTASDASGATWAITDGNQLRYTGFGGIRDNTSYLLSAGQTLSSVDPSLPRTFQVVYGLRHETVEDPLGAASVSASSYGSSVLTDNPNQGPAAAFDDDPTTSWVANAANGSVGQWVSINFGRNLPMSSVVLTPLRGGRSQPQITRVTITTDGGSVVRNVPLGVRSVRLSLPRGTSRALRMRIDAVTGGTATPEGLVLGAGISGIAIPGVTFQPRMRVPDDEASTFSSPGKNLPIVSFSRQVVNPNFALGEEPSDDPDMARLFTLPKSMNSAISGFAVASTTGPYLENLLNGLNQAPMPTTIQVTASSTLGGLPVFRPQNVVDSDKQPWIAGLNDRHPTITLSWQQPRLVDSMSIGLSPYASAPTEISITDGAGKTQYLAVPPKGGRITFSPVESNSLTIGFVSVTKKLLGATPSDGVVFALPVGLGEISVPGLIAPSALTGSTRFVVPCGKGPQLHIDGDTVQTTLSGTVDELQNFDPIPYTACVAKTGFSLSSGNHTFTARSGKSAFDVTSLSMSNTRVASHTPTRRKALVDQWNDSTRTISVSGGPATILAVAQNYSPAWRASLGSRSLTSIRVDGWQQGFEIPAGSAGKITMVMSPDAIYRLSFLIGVLFLILLAILALIPGHNLSASPLTARRNPGFWVLLLASLVVLTALIGPLSLVAVPLFMIAKKWGTQWIAAVAFLSFGVAGIAAAMDPASLTQAGAGAFGSTAQAATGIAVAAVLASLAGQWQQTHRPSTRADAGR
jgi:arabinofuranan 3-O-arabinosyltransferase